MPRKTTYAQHRAEARQYEAPEIIPPQRPLVYLPLTLSASVAFAREVDARLLRFGANYDRSRPTRQALDT